MCEVTLSEDDVSSSIDQLNQVGLGLVDSAMFLVDEHGSITAWPAACVEMTGWTAERVMGLLPLQLLAGEASPPEPAGPAVVCDVENSWCGWLVRSDGSRFVARIRVANDRRARTEGGLRVGVVADVTAAAFTAARIALGDASRILIPFDGDESVLYERVVRVVHAVLTPQSTAFIPHRVAPGVRTFELRADDGAPAYGTQQGDGEVDAPGQVVEFAVEDEFETIGVLRVQAMNSVTQFGAAEREFLAEAASAIVTGSAAARSMEEERQATVARERERIGRDLHDTLSQQLFATQLMLESVARNSTEARTREDLSSILWRRFGVPS